MRLLIWNANQGLDRKWEALEATAPDVAVIPECAEPARLRCSKLVASCEWAGENPVKGLGVFSFNEYRVVRYDSYSRDHRIFLPVTVTGPTQFNLLAVWSFYYRAGKGLREDTRATVRALEYYSDFIQDGPGIVAGDFNDNVLWDKQRRGEGFQESLDALATSGFASVYHENFREDFGRESRPTLTWRRSRSTTYHVDYCFVSPSTWARGASIRVGQPDQWLPLSDHCPLVVELPGIARPNEPSENVSREKRQWRHRSQAK